MAHSLRVFLMLYMALTVDDVGVIAIVRARENGITIAYEIALAPDGRAVYKRSPLDIDGEPIACEEREYALDDLRKDPHMPPIITWLARGLGGIPRVYFPRE